jgi:hypothetical protein
MGVFETALVLSTLLCALVRFSLFREEKCH